MLTNFFSLIFDASHWWLPAIDRFFKEFPDGKAIGLYRDTRACVQSFARTKGQGKGAFNHWVASKNGIWSANNWDPTYPTYEIPEHASDDPDAARAQLMTRYVEEYNHELFTLAKRNRRKMMLIRTEELADPGVQENMFEFIGQRANLPSMLLNRKRHVLGSLDRTGSAQAAASDAWPGACGPWGAARGKRKCKSADPARRRPATTKNQARGWPNFVTIRKELGWPQSLLLLD
jgi:hypothetical protein